MTYKESLKNIEKNSQWHTASNRDLYHEGFLTISDKMLQSNRNFVMDKIPYVYVDVITYKLFLGRMLLNRNFKF